MINKIFVILLSITISSCTIGPDYQAPKLNLPEQFKFASKHLTSSAKPEENWWMGFNDQVLNDLIDQAFDNNKDIAIALSRIDQSRALSDRAFGELFPLGQITATNERGKNSGARFPGRTGSGFDYEVYNGSLEASWELDLLGRLRRDLEAKRADLLANQADFDDTILVLLSSLSKEYLNLRAQQAQLEIAKNAWMIQRKTKKIVSTKFEYGEAGELDLARIKTSLANSRANIPVIQQRINSAARRIAVLVGKNPEALFDLLLKPQELPEYKSSLRITSPEMVIRNRPDVRAAEKRLESFTAGIGVAIGELFPKITLTGTLGLEAGAYSLLGSQAKTYRYGPSMVWSPLYTGRVRSKIKLARAQANEALLQYEQKVLFALEDAANSLNAFRTQLRRLSDLQKAKNAANKAYEIADFQYREGLISLIDVMDVQNKLLQSEQAQVDSKTDLSLSIVSINQAFAGGWSIDNQEK